VWLALNHQICVCNDKNTIANEVCKAARVIYGNNLSKKRVAQICTVVCTEIQTNIKNTLEHNLQRWWTLDKAVYINSARSKAYVCGHSPAETVGSNSATAIHICYECCVLSGRSLRDELITRPEESYRLCVCDLQISIKRRPWPALDRRTKSKERRRKNCPKS